MEKALNFTSKMKIKINFKINLILRILFNKHLLHEKILIYTYEFIQLK